MGWIKLVFLVSMLQIFILGMATGQKNVITLNDGGYSNVLIAIDRKVPENLTIIENLKTMFTSASQRLYDASKQHVYWKHIKILVPNTWSIQNQYSVATTESSRSANIIVHDFPDDEPYVDNPEGCGKGALNLMHLTPNYILNEQYRHAKFGNTSNVLLRSWGYLRWGLFPENYVGKGVDTPFYNTSGNHGNSVLKEETGTRCSLEVKGEILFPNKNICSKNSMGFYHGDCLFFPDGKDQSAAASLLFATRDVHINSVVGFCEEEDNHVEKGNWHNTEAPNLMNHMCGGDSAWKVMKEETQDFLDDIPTVLNTTPEFEIVQVSMVRSVVLVLDISGSMIGDRFNRMIQACTDYILYVIPVDSKLGIVVFESSSEIKENLLDITDGASRQRLVDHLPSYAGGGTCIGCGILKGIEVLGSFSKGGYMLLLSDGEDNSLSITDAIDEIENAGVIIDTVTISNSADQQMEDLSRKTSGRSSFCLDTGTGNCLIQQFQDTVSTRPDVGVGKHIIQIYNSEVKIEPDPGFLVIYPVVIDDALGDETVITVAWTEDNLIQVLLFGPDNTYVDHTDPRYHNDTLTKIVSINLPKAQAGQWYINISGVDIVDHVSVSVTSKPSSDDFSPVTMNVLLESPEVKFLEEPVVNIYVQVQQNYLPVLNAEVTAFISDSDQTHSEELLDDGKDPDILKDDGTYSTSFQEITTDGRYSVKVDAIGFEEFNHSVETNGTIKVKRSAESDTIDTAAVPSFMRTVSGGVFKVIGYTPNAPDILPPSRIQDLVYTSFSYHNGSVTLSWTAVGDNLDQGTAHSYELRYSTNFLSVRTNFSNCDEITQDELVHGNISNINPPGVTETITVTLPESGQDRLYYFAIRAWDEAGNVGDLSNILSLFFIRLLPVSTETTTEGTLSTEQTTNQTEPGDLSTETISSEELTTRQTTPDQERNPGEPNKAAMIIGLSCAGGVIVLVLGVILCIYYRKTHMADMKPQSTDSVQDNFQGVQVVRYTATYDNPTYSTN
ncbi:calcium-activated chloride channel regulator 1-like [Lytechinus pictus]|uniref:calcium-activated chloride channel regulator 1-like n=1 Tax=Lytechinus pictus TaxID=7653 RepID=UPI0030B9F93F